MTSSFVVEGDPSSWKTSYVESAQNMFNKEVPVIVKSSDREERVEELTIRILLGIKKHEHNAKVLRIQATNELDPFFFHSMEVTEEEFQNLKIEQSILVDFATFPTKFIELIEECIRCRGEENPRFQAVLRIGENDSNLGLVETNLFKHLSHLSLRLKAGDDASIKQFLAARLFDVKDERDKAREGLDSSNKAVDVLKAELDAARAELAAERENAARAEALLGAKFAEQMAVAKREALQEIEETKTRLEQERLASEQAQRVIIDSLQKRNQELDAQVRELLEQKYGLDSRVSDLSSRLGTAEGELTACREELTRLREQNADLDMGTHERDKGLNQRSLKIEWLEQQVADKEELIKVLKGRLESAEMHKKAVEDTLAETRITLAKSEDRVSASAGEIRKGNQIIERLQAELRSAKAKAKLKAAVIAQQETLLGERQNALDKAAREAAELTRDVDAAKGEARQLTARVEDQKKKLEESQALLTSNQQMIQWLNTQVNEAQLGKMGASSRYAFRPSVPLPTPSVTVSGGAAGDLGGSVPRRAYDAASTARPDSTSAGGPVTYKPRVPSGAAAQPVSAGA